MKALALVLLGLFLAVSSDPCYDGCSGCGNNVCEVGLGESCDTCPADCGMCPSCNNICGNLRCETNETSCNCPGDCGACCLDGRCTKGENFDNCFADCSGGFSGLVYDSDTNAPLVASVTCQTAECVSTAKPLPVQTPASGRFSYSGLEPAYYTCTATADGYVSNSRAVTVSPGTWYIPFIPIPLSKARGSLSGRTRTSGSWLGSVNVTCSSGAERALIRTSDPNGEFYFKNVAPGNYTCVGVKNSYAAGSAFVTVGNTNAVVNIDLLPLNAFLSGVVSDRFTGAGVGAASVSCSLLGTSTTFNTTANAAGIYTFPNVSVKQGGEVLCRATKDGYTIGRNSACFKQGDNVTVNIVIQPLPGNINGTVKDSLTGALLTANVVCTSTISQGSDTTTPASYLIPSIPPTRYSCTASSVGYLSKTISDAVLSGKTTQIDFILDPAPGNIIGTVYDAETNAVLNATVVCSRVGAVLAATSSSANGYSYTNVVSTAYNCTATATNYVDGGNFRSTVVPRGGSARIDIYLFYKRGNLVGTAFDSLDGFELPATSVRCVGMGDVRTGTTDANGGYSFSNVRIGLYACTGSKSLYTDGSNSGTAVYNSTVRIDLQLTPFPASIVGRTYDVDEPTISIGSASVTCTVNSSRNTRQYRNSTTTDANSGSYRFVGITVFGGASCSGSKAGYTDGSGNGTVTIGQQTTINIPLRALPGGIIGTVYESGSNKKLPGARVVCTQGSSFSATTDQNGFYYIPSLVRGPYSCVASLTGWTSQTVTVTVLAAQNVTQDFVLSPATIVGTVFDVDSRALIQTAQVTCTAASIATTPFGPSTPGSSYQFQYVPSTTYNCTATATNYVSGGNFNNTFVAAGSISRIDIFLKLQDGGLTVITRDAYTNEIVTSAQVSCTSSLQSVSGITDDTGSKPFGSVKIGSYNCVGTKSLYTDGSANISVVAGQPATVTILLAPYPAAIDGTVFDSETRAGIANSGVSCTVTQGSLIYSNSASANTTAGYYFGNIKVYGAAVCTANATGYVTNSASGFTSIGKLTTIHIPLVPHKGGIVGTTLNFYDGTIVPRSSVVCSGPSGTVNATSDDNGFFYFPNLRLGNYSCTGSKTLYFPGSNWGVVVNNQNVTVNLRLTPYPAAITGRVYDILTNESLPRDSVSCSAIQGSRTFTNQTTTNSTAGYFFEGITVYALATCTATYTGYGAGSGTGNLVIGGTTRIDIGLGPQTGGIIGTTLDFYDGSIVPRSSVVCSGPSGTVNATSSDTGFFYFPNLRLGNYSCTGSKALYFPGSNWGVVVNNQNVTVNLRLTPYPAAITGTVIDRQTGRALPAGPVSCSVTQGSRSYSNSTTTNSTAGFFFGGITVYGTAVCNATYTGYSAAGGQAPLPIGSTANITIYLVPLPGSLIGTVFEAGSRIRLANASVTCEGSSGEEYFAYTNQTGDYAFMDVPAGVYDCYAFMNSSYMVDVGSPQVFRGNTTRQDFVLKRLSDLTVIVKEAFTDQTVNLYGARVEILQEGMLIEYNFTSRPDSSVRFQQYLSGIYSVNVSFPNYTPFLRSDILIDETGRCVNASICRNGTILVELSPKNSSISGFVRDNQTGSAVSNAQVELVLIRTSGSNATFRTTTDNNGFYSIGVEVFTSVISWYPVITASGYEPQARILPNPGPNVAVKNFNFGMKAIITGNFQGRVVESSAVPTPIANATVYLSTVYLNGSAALFNLLTNATGGFFMKDAPVGSHNLTFSHPLFKTTTGIAPVGSGDPGNTVFTFEMVRKRTTLTVIVRDAADPTQRPGSSQILVRAPNLGTNIDPLLPPLDSIDLDVPLGSVYITASTPDYKLGTATVIAVEGLNPPVTILLEKLPDFKKR